MGTFIDLPPPGRPRADLLIGRIETVLQNEADEGETITTVLTSKSKAEVDDGWVDHDLVSSSRHNKYFRYEARKEDGKKTWESPEFVLSEHCSPYRLQKGRLFSR